MIFLKDSIRYENVLSKKCEFYYKDMGQNLEAFLSAVKRLGVHPDGPLFYALNNVPRDERMKVEFFLPIREEIASGPEIKFHSYYSVEHMISMRILDEFEKKTEEAYSALLQFMEQAGLEQITPPYHIIDQVGKQNFVTVKVGYLKKE